MVRISTPVAGLARLLLEGQPFDITVHAEKPFRVRVLMTEFLSEAYFDPVDRPRSGSIRLDILGTVDEQ